MLEKLSKDFNYMVEGSDTTGGRIVVTRISDGATKTFVMAAIRSKDGVLAVTNFMNSMTDELLEGYWPKPRKAKETK